MQTTDTTTEVALQAENDQLRAANAELKATNEALAIQLKLRDGGLLPPDILDASYAVFRPEGSPKPVADHLLHIAYICREWLRNHKYDQAVIEAAKKLNHAGLERLVVNPRWLEVLTRFGACEASEFVADLAVTKDVYEVNAIVGRFFEGE